MIFVGPVGVGKTFLVQALGASRPAPPTAEEQLFRRYLAPDLLLIDDLGLHRLSAQQSSDLYELIIERHRRSSLIFTSHRGVDEWLRLFDDPILGNSALDRLAHNAHQVVIEGPSYRARLAPKSQEVAM